MLEDIQGQIERVTFHNDETGFTIARLKVKGFRELVTAVGNLMAPVPGQVIQMQPASGRPIRNSESNSKSSAIKPWFQRLSQASKSTSDLDSSKASGQSWPKG